jgi:hypothetical protein
MARLQPPQPGVFGRIDSEKVAGLSFSRLNTEAGINEHCAGKGMARDEPTKVAVRMAQPTERPLLPQ